MTTPRPRLTREQAFEALTKAGWPTGLFRTNLGLTVPFPTLAVAIASAESDLYVDAQGPPNTDGTIDRGWLQINSVHGYDDALLKSDAAYTAAAALQILLQQGVRAWAAYGVRNAALGNYPYARRMPPGMGGGDLASGSRGDLQRSLQAFLNRDLALVGSGRLVEDGAYGPKTQAQVTAWKRRFASSDTVLPVTAQTWAAMSARGLR